VTQDSIKAISCPFEVINAQAITPYLLLSDHGGCLVPDAYQNLGLPASVLQRHIGWDIGAAAVTRCLAQALSATALISRYSRLLIDCNRGLDHPDVIAVMSDGVQIPGNQGLSQAEKDIREQLYYRPYHDEITRQIKRLTPSDSLMPAVLSIHSFTPVMDDFKRPWEIGVLWDQDDRIAKPLMAALRTECGVVVGDNEPYSGREALGGSVERHATEVGRPSVLIEIRQDLISDLQGVYVWSKMLATALKPILACRDLYQSFLPKL